MLQLFILSGRQTVFPGWKLFHQERTQWGKNVLGTWQWLGIGRTFRRYCRHTGKEAPLPAGHKDKNRKFYEELFKEMCSKIVQLQQADGYWRASLLDASSYPSPETSGTAFYVYAFAYGINHGLLPKEEYLPALQKGWKALVNAVDQDGKLGYVQPIGEAPKKVTREMTELYGPGAFLMGGCEIYKMSE